MESDGSPLGGRHLLLAEELALLAIAERNGAFPGTPALEVGLAGAVLVELRERRAVVIDGSHLASVERWPIGDTVLDEVVREVEGSAPSVRQCVDRIARRGLAATLVDRLERRGIVARHRDVVIGILPVTRYGVVPPRFRQHWAERIGVILRDDARPDARERAMLPLLAAVGLVRGFADPAERIRLSRTAHALGRRDPIHDTVARTIAHIDAAAAAVMVAVTA